MGQDLTVIDSLVLDELFRTRRSKWTFRIVLQLRQDTKRFSELQRGIGSISQKSLAQALKTLERDGIVQRRSYAVIPPRVEYRLSALGLDLLAAFEAMELFAARHWSAVLAARQEYDARGPSAVNGFSSETL